MRKLWWTLGAAAVLGGIYRIGDTSGFHRAQRVARDSLRQVAKDSDFASEVLHARTATASRRTDSAIAGRRARQHREAAAQLASQAAADAEHRERDSIAALLPALANAQDSIRTYQLLDRQDLLVINHLEETLVHTGDVAEELTAQRDSALADRDRWKVAAESDQRAKVLLAAALEREVAAGRCRIGPGFLHIGCPARTAVAIGGILVGAGVGFVIAR